uniref:Uncharacterized protein n=1 Tax=Rhizophora mucronata TaxID=61149 RepID=A0A2P2QDS6_RHIMU
MFTINRTIKILQRKTSLLNDQKRRLKSCNPHQSIYLKFISLLHCQPHLCPQKIPLWPY